MRRGAVGLAGAATALVLLAGYAGLDVADAVPGPLTTTPPPTAEPLPTAPAAAAPDEAPAPVLAPPGTAAPVPGTTALQERLAPLLADPALGPAPSAVVSDALTGEVLLSLAADAPRTPASVTKLLTAAAALHVLGPGSRAATTVVRGTSPDEVVLVAGGDVLLSAGTGDPGAVAGRAGLADLAAATADALREAGTGTVAVRLDDALFSGPAVSPAWGAGDVAAGYVAPVAPLAVDEGRLVPGQDAPRAADPALEAARTFARLLAEQGVAVAPADVDGGVARAAADSGAPVLARVESATTAEQVELVLTESDNTLAEVLGRRVALATGRPGTFEDAGAAVAAAVADLGVDVTGVQLQGVSGLGRGTRLPARVLTDLLVLATSDERPELSALLSGLPVAGVTGTLAERYRGESAAAAGVVRAKTGTLTGVSSLAGYVRDADGRVLAFAVLSDAVPAGASWGARRAEDALAAALAACGCS
ncbi:D-alanyl-D-alanine carboxypeptidase/D-alanyl-D-alanine endopeptidase [Kineococcus arenarius]|uniref:D-alanyl-D-alanine carboxypeptidase/D-alanyl-D-alanine endopeptidase n=1 Tax=Kineococcus sp. SYSU DK019 TaxID=3383140 RepID=UPI003D7EABD2